VQKNFEKHCYQAIYNFFQNQGLSNPSSDTLNKQAKSIRRSETFLVSQAIHGGSEENKEPTICGMIDTLISKCKSEKLAIKLLNSKRYLKHSLERQCQRQYKNKHESSKENLLCSLNVYYAHSVMGKRKYINIRKANTVKEQPNYVAYPKLANHMTKIDIGNVYNIDPIFTENVPNEEKGEGLFQNVVEFCPRLAKFYI